MRTLKYHVQVDGENNYKFTHGRYPRGEGHWAFQIGEEIVWITCKYSIARSQAQAKARQLGIYSIKVLT